MRSRAWTHVVRVAALAFCLTLALGGRAQDVAVQPPRVVSLHDVVLPGDVAIPESGTVEATILVRVDGGASVEACEAEAALCARVTESLAQARFEPARRAGVAIAVRIRIALRVAQEVPAADGGAPNGAGAPAQGTAATGAAPSSATGTAPSGATNAAPSSSASSAAPSGTTGAASSGISGAASSGTSGTAPRDAAGAAHSNTAGAAHSNAAGAAPSGASSTAPSGAAPSGGATGVAALGGGAEAQSEALGPAQLRSDEGASAGEYGARARVQQIKQPGMRRLELAELRDMPGAFGDPFRAVEVLPGIVPMISGLPYFYVRGSPPAGSVYYYDGMPVPALYHLGLGPAVIHPQMVGPIRLYSGVAPARYGRLTGGAIVGEGPEPNGATRGEAELRLLDASAFVHADALGGKLTVAGRYGYPGLIVSLVSPEVSVAYWDYQLRYQLPVSEHTRLELVSLGSYDTLATGPDISERLTLQFHRLEPRFIYHTFHDELGLAVTGGWDESALGEILQLSSARLTPRAWYEHRFAGGSRLRLSLDAQSLWGGKTAQSEDTTELRRIGFGDLGRGYRGVLGAQVELSLPLTAAFELQAGARVDAWLQRGHAYPALDPRLRAIVHANDTLDFHVAGGLTHQPAVPVIPLPGLADYADARELQSALQLEAGVGVDLPIDLRAELQLFAHRYKNLVFADSLLNNNVDENCIDGQCTSPQLPTHVDGLAYGMELFLRRPFTHALSGVLSYTMAWANVERVLGLQYTPSWDVRHLLNLVLQWEIGGGFALGVRVFFRSGKASGEFYTVDSMLGRNERRLPGFFRGDVQLSYSWKTSWSHMRFGLEFFNFTISREAISAQGCSMAAMSCSVEYVPAIFAPNLSLRANIP